MKKLSQLIPPIHKPIVLEWEDIRTIIQKEDIQFGPVQSDGWQTVEREPIDVTAVDLEIDLNNALDLLNRVSDMFQGLPARLLESLLSSADYQSVLDLDRDVASYLAAFDHQEDQ